VSVSERLGGRIAAYHDGELSWWGRLRLERRLRRDPEAQAELEALRSVASLVGELDAAAPTPDLWSGLRERLPAQQPTPRWVGARVASPGWLRPAAPWAAAGVAAAALALALLSAPPDATEVDGAVRWLDAGGRPMMVLRDDREATIIWVPEARREGAGSGEIHHAWG
jgi:anti-sigma factor RsiW